MSPGVLKKMVYAGTNAGSFQQAERDLAVQAELSISAQRIMRATKRIGRERAVGRVAAVEAWRKLPLPAQQRSPHEHVPQVACVQVDGGRIQIRERGRADRGRDDADGFWRETKVACLLRMHSRAHQSDPCPVLPESFANIARMNELCREIKGLSPAAAASPEAGEGEPTARPGRPQVLARNVVAMRACASDFAAHVATTAWESGFAAAQRKAFVADGQASNWSIWREYFSHYTPIVDFVHAVCYVFQAAAAGRPLDEVAPLYRRWAQAVWSGNVQEVIAELRALVHEWGPPPPEAAVTDPRTVLTDSLRYLSNQAERMKYDEYRRQGLPITSAHIESTIKQLNRRVKGSEKFWSEGGAQALLQLAGDYLSDRAPLDQFWRDRTINRTGQRCYR